MKTCLRLAGLIRRRALAFVMLAHLCLFASASLAATHERTAEAASHLTAPELSAASQTVMHAIHASLEAKEWDAAATAVKAWLKASPPGSYDRAMAHLHRAQVELSRDDDEFAARRHRVAIESLEYVSRSGFWNRTDALDFKRTLAQLYAVEDELEAAERTMEGWLAESPAPTTDAFVLLVTVMLERAQREPALATTDRYQRALAYVGAGLRLGTRPDPNLLYLKAACFQALGLYDDVTETLEFLLDLQPATRAHWEQLYASYVESGRNLAAILTIERARAFGALESAQADLALGQHYYQLAQHDRALDAFEAGLSRGIADPAPHWLFAAWLAFQRGDAPRAARLLASAEPVLVTDAQRRDFASLREALAARPSAGQ